MPNRVGMEMCDGVTMFGKEYAMEIRPVRDYAIPEYPTKKDATRCPELLRGCARGRWRRVVSAGVSGALVAAFSMSGCDKDSCVQRSPQVAVDSDEQFSDVPAGQAEQEVSNGRRRPALVAPVFEHGAGRGATGCVVMGPPQFLSEEEAMVIIKAELAACGVVPDRRQVKIKGVWDGYPVIVDAEDGSTGILIEFIDREDYLRYTGDRSGSTVQQYDALKVAGWLRGKMNLHLTEGTLGVFYDPLVAPEWGNEPFEGKSLDDRLQNAREQWRDAHRQAAEASRALLRQQVRDFVGWLREQKVI